MLSLLTVRLSGAQRRHDQARPAVRDPHRRQPDVVPRPVRRDLRAQRLLRRASSPNGTEAFIVAVARRRCCSSPRSSRTSSATRSSRAARACRSRASTCGRSAASRARAASRRRRAPSCGSRRPGPAVNAARDRDLHRRRPRVRQLPPLPRRRAARVRACTPAPRSCCSSWLALINAVLLVFNLLPALPLDGGRIARAIVWRLTGDANRATRACARLGQLLGVRDDRRRARADRRARRPATACGSS